MSKRTDAIRSLFAGASEATLSADNVPQPARVSAGAVRSLRGSFSDAERENEDLRRKLAAGSQILEVDPSIVDPSPVADRFEERDPAAYETLKASIRQRGQEVPVLMREHPTAPGRYQSAYGHRRVRVARELGVLVKAVIRSMSDEDLVVAQGVENSAREDLSFIERAVFAGRLEEAGHNRSIVQEALSVDRAEASKLVAIARAIPLDIIDWIGKAPKVGRGRWQALAEQFQQPAAIRRAREIVKASTVAEPSSDQRFLVVLAATTQNEAEVGRAVAAPVIVSNGGQDIARLQKTGRNLNIAIDRSRDPGFADFLIDELPRLHDRYVASVSKSRRET